MSKVISCEKLFLRRQTMGTRGIFGTFEDQVRRLLEKSYAAATGLTKKQLIQTLNQLRFAFQSNSLIVIPNAMMPTKKVLERIELKNKKATSLLNLGEVHSRPGIQTSYNGPYLIHGIHDGSDMTNSDHQDCVRKFFLSGDNKHQPLNVDEGLAMLTHRPEILNKHWVDLYGSYYKRKQRILTVCYKNQPLLTWLFAEGGKTYNSTRDEAELQKRGAAFCRSKTFL